MSNQYEIKTTDTPLAAALMTMGAIYIGLQESDYDNNRIDIIFDMRGSDWDPQAVESLYNSNRLPVDAKTMINHYRFLIDKINEFKRQKSTRTRESRGEEQEVRKPDGGQAAPKRKAEQGEIVGSK